jgi:hypothetical protein
VRESRSKTYHLEPLLHGGSTLEVGGGGVDVVVNLLLGQINHVGGEKGLAVELEVALVLIEHAIEPGQELLGAVVSVKDDGDAVGGGNAADVVGSGDSAGNGGGLALVADTLVGVSLRALGVTAGVGVGAGAGCYGCTYLAGEEGGTTLRSLQDDGALLVASGLKGSDDGGGGGDVLVIELVGLQLETLEYGVHSGVYSKEG